MKKTLLLAVMFGLVGCKGKFVWVSTAKETKPAEVTRPELNKDLSGVQFTFDDGPNLAYTPKILDILKQHKLQAIFFVEGINLVGESEQANERRQLLKRAVEEGHIIGNHTYDHKDVCRISEEKAAWEIDSTTKLIEGITGQKVTYFRSPYGKKCRILSKLLGNRNITQVGWEIDSREWQRDLKTHQFKTPAQVIDGIMLQYKNLHDEQGIQKLVIILHDTKRVTAELLPDLLERLSKEQATK